MFEQTVSLWRRLIPWGRRPPRKQVADSSGDDLAPAPGLLAKELADGDLQAFGARRVRPDGQDYRAWVRFPCDADASCLPVQTSQSPQWSARVLNISPAGIGLLLPRRFEPGTVLNIDLPGSSHQGNRGNFVLASIVHATPQGDGQWMLGCTFATELSDDDLRDFGVERVLGTDSDCRTFVRYPCNLEMTYRPVREPEPLSVRVLNLSASGIGLLVPRSLESGTLLSIDLLGPGGQPVLTVLACVVYVRARGEDGWLVGCNFASELSDRDLGALR